MLSHREHCNDRDTDQVQIIPSPRLAEFLSSIKDSWLQFINHGDESIYDLLNGVAIYKVPATAVPKTEMELLFEVCSCSVQDC